MSIYCSNCMKPIESGATICPYCKQPVHIDAPSHHLKPGTVLHGRYLVGKARGQGGFGITYIGFDTTLDVRVAIKEYYPNGFSSRNHDLTDNVTVTLDDTELYEKGKARFLQEAKTLARFYEEPGIVSVHDFFEENNTAYIVMEYLDGITLKRFVEAKGKIPPDSIFRVIRPLINALEKVHTQGVVHRDISPDNIMVLRNGSLKLLDFGAAREVGGDKSLSVMLKHGYAPYEQYRSTGEQGPWTDIYALCATIYFCLTGIRPESSVDRMENDTLQRPSELGVKIEQSKESVLLHGMSLRVRDRYKSLSELKNALYGSDNAQKGKTIDIVSAEPSPQESQLEKVEKSQKPVEIEEKSQNTSGKKRKKQRKAPVKGILLSSLVAFLCLAVLLVATRFSHKDSLTSNSIVELAAMLPMNNISISSDHAVAIRENGTVIAAGNNEKDQCEVSEWQNIVSVEAGEGCTFAIGKNGYAIVVGDNSFGQFDLQWEYLKDISVNSNHIVGLHEDGTVVAVGKNEYGECNTNNWEDIIAVSAGWKHTVGLKSDGTVVAVGSNDEGQCDVNNWANIVAVSAGALHTVGLTSDGHVIAVGNNIDRECNVQDWTDIIAVDAGNTHTVGIRKDGTAVAVGTNLMGECNVNTWTDLIAINAGGSTTMGLRKDGTIVSTATKISTPWYGIKTTQELPDESLRKGIIPDDQSVSGITWEHDYATKSLVFTGVGLMRDYTVEEGIVLPWTKYKGNCDLVVIKNGITEIGNCTFAGMTNLSTGEGIKKVLIPRTVTRIGALAFEFCFDLSDVYYEGSEEEWNQITIEKNNTFLTNSLIHYNSTEIDVSPDVTKEIIPTSQKSRDDLLAEGEQYLVDGDYGNALEYLLAAADAGSAEAMFSIGFMYSTGTGVDKDYSKGMEWYQKSADLGFGDAMYIIGEMYSVGKGVTQDYSKAMEWYKKAAAAGSYRALTSIGDLYIDGKGVNHDEVEAMRWYEKAAQFKDADAMYKIAWLYLNGLGVNPDDKTAMEWFQEAANAGNIDAMWFAGMMYSEGRGVTQDYNKALEWYQKAANAGDAHAMYAIGNMYRDGKGVDQDYTKAIEWYQKAANAGNAAAMEEIGWMYYSGTLVSKDYAKALEWYQRAANGGNALAMNDIGDMYRDGVGVEQDYNKALEWYQNAANLNDADAFAKIGWMYLNGFGVSQDFAKTLTWYEKAASAGNSSAMAVVGRLYEKGLGVEQDFGKAMEWYQKSADAGDNVAMECIGDMYYNGIGVEQDYTTAQIWYKKAVEAGNADTKAKLAQYPMEAESALRQSGQYSAEYATIIPQNPTTIYMRAIQEEKELGQSLSFVQRINYIFQSYNDRFDSEGIEHDGRTEIGYSSKGYSHNKYGFYYADGNLYYAEAREDDGVVQLYFWDGKLIAAVDYRYGDTDMVAEGGAFEKIKEEYGWLYGTAMSINFSQ